MARRKNEPDGPTPVDALRHDDKRRNIPPIGARDFVSEEVEQPRQVPYPRDTSLDPQLVWKGKDEENATPGFDVAAPPSSSRRRSTLGCWSRTSAVPSEARTRRSPRCSTSRTSMGSRASRRSTSTSTAPTGRTG